MKLLELSKIAYNECKYGHNTIENRNMIFEDKYRFYYCLYIRDDQRIWGKIKDGHWAYMYCRNVKDRKELWRKIDRPWDAYVYCRKIEDRPELRKIYFKGNVKKMKKRYLNMYGLNSLKRKEAKEMRSLITHCAYAFRYCRDIRDDQEVRKYIFSDDSMLKKSAI